MRKIFLIAALAISVGAANAQEKIVEKYTAKVAKKSGGDINEGGQDEVYNFASVEVKPVFPGVAGAFQEAVLKNVDPSDNGIEGPINSRVYVSFVIDENGAMENIRITRDPGYRLGDEVKEAVQKVKQKWSPGIKNGEKVKVNYSAPILIHFTPKS